MKKIALVFISLICISLAFVSCEKDDKEDAVVEVKETSIEGKWIRSLKGTRANGQDVLVVHPHAIGCNKDYTLFSTAGIAKDYDYIKEGANCEEDITTYYYTRVGNKLTVNFGEGLKTATIEKLTDTELKISTVNSNITFVEVYTKG